MRQWKFFTFENFNYFLCLLTISFNGPVEHAVDSPPIHFLFSSVCVCLYYVLSGHRQDESLASVCWDTFSLVYLHLFCGLQLNHWNSTNVNFFFSLPILSFPVDGRFVFIIIHRSHIDVKVVYFPSLFPFIPFHSISFRFARLPCTRQFVGLSSFNHLFVWNNFFILLSWIIIKFCAFPKPKSNCPKTVWIIMEPMEQRKRKHLNKKKCALIFMTEWNFMQIRTFNL